MVDSVKLNDGTAIPQLGFGTYLVPPEETAATVGAALEVGYRHIDTAQGYKNEAEVGEAVASSGIPRDEIYLTSKLHNGHHLRDDVIRTFEETLEKLRVDRLDLFLIHWPLPTRYDGDFVSTWKAMLELKEDGRLTSAGVSNFQPDHLQQIVDATGEAPAVNQIEVHPYFRNEAARQASHDHAVAVEAWGPLGQGAVLDDATVAEIAAETGRAPSQVILRWHLERGDIIFPKSMKRERMEENFAIFDFTLTPEQMERIDALDQGAAGRQGPDPDTFDMV